MQRYPSFKYFIKMFLLRMDFHSVKFVFMRNDQENIYRQIQDAINNLPDNFSILEEQIDVELQLEYFNFSKELRNELMQKLSKQKGRLI
jgi:hypothetical protein